MGEEFNRQLLDLIPKERNWMGRGGGGGGGRGNGLGVEEEKRLELRLGLPGSGDEDMKGKREDPSVLSLGYFSNGTTSNPCAGNRGFVGVVEPKPEGFGNGKGEQQQRLERKSGYHRPAHGVTDASGNANSSQIRTDTVPIVGWPPIRSFRKNIASTSKPSLESQNGGLETAAKLGNGKRGMFVKINMDGVPIGRKVDLGAYNNYDKLSLAVDELFRGLLSAQRDLLAGGTINDTEGKQVFTGLLDGTGEYTLVYEDNEGDRMLVGDVPWEMFVSTAKRLRVLKTSDLSALCLGAASGKRHSSS